MAQLTLIRDNLPTPEGFRRTLSKMMEKSNPVDELLELSLELHEQEQEFGMKSADFYQKFQHGEMGDSDKVIHWAIVYHSFLEQKKQVETALMREAIWHEAAPVPA